MSPGLAKAQCSNLLTRFSEIGSGPLFLSRSSNMALAKLLNIESVFPSLEAVTLLSKDGVIHRVWTIIDILRNTFDLIRILSHLNVP